MNLPVPIVKEIDYSKNELNSLEKVLQESEEKKYIFNYPTVYIVNDKNNGNSYSVYVGETTDIKRRTGEHFNIDPLSRKDWEMFANSDTAKMFIIAHSHFNKSLTLDIENRLMQYLMSVDNVNKINNRRNNPQNDYYTSNEFEKIFSRIWNQLHHKNHNLFPIEKIIRDSALFKASPFHKLTEEQLKVKDEIILKISEAITRNKSGQLIFVEGEAGSGKTVLMSNLFYELNQLSNVNSENPIFHKKSQFLLVNHDQQLTVYKQIATKLGILTPNNKETVSKPTRFINNHSIEEKVDVVLVDEAHLLWTQGKQAYRGKNQLNDLLERARVVVAIFDRNQILSREQFWEKEDLLEKLHEANLNHNYLRLNNQLRINADQNTVNWIRRLIDKQKIDNIPKDSKGYEIKIFDTPNNLQKEILFKTKDNEHGISRLLATFDWDYVDKESPKNENYWYVKVGDWKMPWNLQLKPVKEERLRNKGKSWAEQSQTINEVGSTFTIQGFDLNYAGVIIGPSVKYRNGRIIFDSSASKNKKATTKRTFKNKEKVDVSDTLLKNELNVLLTRGVNGLYIYAVDLQLRNALWDAKEGLL